MHYISIKFPKKSRHLIFDFGDLKLCD